MKEIKRLAIVINAHKPNAESLAQTLRTAAESLGVTVKHTLEYPIKQDFLKGQDACCVLGGDGTLLGVVPESIAHQVPVFGVNQGKLGFLATFTADEVMTRLERLLKGNYTIVKRSVIRCRTVDGQKALALNDAVIKSRSISRLISLQVFSDNEWVTEYFCDGLIFSTPTGSTAYNLSAGGPIVTPGAGIMTMTPICPHTLTNRSVVFAHDTVLRVDSKGNETEPHFSLDGIHHFDGTGIFPLELSIEYQSLSLLQPQDYSYYRVLRQKLKW
jgi:NAD+ kinase